LQAKHEQVGRLENKLENLIDQQQSKLMLAQKNQPGFFSLPRTKSA